MKEQVSITNWLDRFRGGDRDAAQPIWESYYRQLICLARRKLMKHRRHADEEDVVQSVFESVFRGIDENRFPQLSDSTDLWRILIVVTSRKVASQVNREACGKRGGGRVRGESVFGDPTSGRRGIDQVVGSAPDPELAAEIIEQCEIRLAALPTPELRQVGLMKLQGLTNAEIATGLSCGLRTVERKLRLIRDIWSLEIDGE